MKNFLYFISLLFLLSSCASTRSSSAVKHRKKPVPASDQPRFLENITIKATADEETDIEKPSRIKASKDVPGALYSADIEKVQNLQFKYAILMDQEVEMVTNEKLIGFLEDWYGAPYRYGGETKKGIDCSAFTGIMMDTVYNITLPRTAREQYKKGDHINKSRLIQGDLVFFNTTGGVSHVGVYLGNNKFVHASASSGVMISDLDDSYFKRRYIGSARVR